MLRKALFDETALIGALKSGRIAGAALDVYDIEPLPRDHPLRQLDNCILLLHFGYVTREIYGVLYRETAEAVARYLDRTIGGQSMIPKSVQRFSEKIMLHE